MNLYHLAWLLGARLSAAQSVGSGEKFQARRDVVRDEVCHPAVTSRP
jgi:hypothetical protein